ncbi:polymorphic toxin type 34 domain-containing protein [Escherichia coli]|nr:polymorphic toxin type 34 domain-containing protein [Escherichia coli]MCF3324849.1 polymorphic toxin type 34 domain-containing protein [Escherichia coli]
MISYQELVRTFLSAKDAKSTQKAWNCRHSRQSNDKKR